MAGVNLNYDSAIRGILQAKTDSVAGLVEIAAAKLKECGLSHNDKTAVHDFPREKAKRGQALGAPKGSENFNARGIARWIESVPAKAETPEDRKVHEQLVAIHATLLAHVR